jgi:hypothetical protein
MEKMQITGYTDVNFKTLVKVDPGMTNPYLVMINPDTIKWQRYIEYNDTQAPDTSTASQKYKSTPSDKLSFDIVIDGTGIVDPDRTDMVNEIGALEKLVFDYNGKIHRPNYVTVQWGERMIFNGVLTSFDVSYTLFRPDGSPLRAKISLGFSMYIAPTTVKKLDNQESPDVSHLVTVVEGMMLPQLCQEVWNDDAYYIQVAKYNKLNKFRNLKGGLQLIFPPIIQPA